MFKTRVVKFGAILGVGTITLGLSVPFAWALPPGGAGADTPGTSSSVSPSTVEQCGTLNFAVNGFPPGETVNIKIDDGMGFSGDAAIQGQGVVHRQPIDASGTAQGSLQIPCDLPAGEHHLRYLASEQIIGEDGVVAGTKGYTNVGNSIFVVVESATGGETTNNSDSGTASGTGGVSTNANQRGNTANQGTTRSNSGVTASTNGGTVAAGDAIANGAASVRTANGGAAAGNTSVGTDNTSQLGGTAAKAGGFGSSTDGVPSNGGIFDKNAQSANPNLAANNGIYAIPFIGFFVGGAILLVGMTAVNTWLYVKRREHHHEMA